MRSKNASNKSIESLNAASEESIRKIREEAERLAALFELQAIKEGNVKTLENADGSPQLPIAPPATAPPPAGISP